jgi:hypothetical protein
MVTGLDHVAPGRYRADVFLRRSAGSAAHHDSFFKTIADWHWTYLPDSLTGFFPNGAISFQTVGSNLFFIQIVVTKNSKFSAFTELIRLFEAGKSLRLPL